MESIKGGLVVSCQALSDEPLHSPVIMGRMALAAKMGGALGIRANGIEDIREIKKNVDLPIIGIIKRVYGDNPVFITPTIKEFEELTLLGVDIIALDMTFRERPDKKTIKQLMKEVKIKFPNQKIMADISNLEEAVEAEKLGVDYVGTTLVGYTSYTKNLVPLEELKKILNTVKIPVIAEGNIDTPEKVKEALKMGAYSVVVGSMITRPQLITKRFVDAIKEI